MKKHFCIVGTDTGVGKTLVSSVLVKVLQGQYFKPIQSGIGEDGYEQDKVVAYTGIDKKQCYDSIYALKAPLSPDQAARKENIKIDLRNCVLPKTDKSLLVEGAGGVYVPLNDSETQIDLLQQYNLPLILVARGALGTINHTMLAIEALRKRGLQIHGVVFNGDLNQENQSAIEKFGKVKTLFHVPYFDTCDQETIVEWINANENKILSGLESAMHIKPTLSLSERDAKVIWHPFTQHQMTSLPKAISRGKGAYLYDENNKKYLDMISSWWVNVHGHSKNEIANAIYEQATTLEHMIFAGFTHEPAVQLAEKIIDLLPAGFSKIFYSDNGSTAVEVAIKMAIQFWHNQGEKNRKRIISFEHGYHGDTFGAMSVSKSSGFHDAFADMLFAVDVFPYPETYMDDGQVSANENHVLELLTKHLTQESKNTAAIVIEPLVQGAGGMKMCRLQFLQKLELVAKEFNVLMIYDEVMTGFYRTGELFACHKAKTNPDIICLSKSLTGGFMPLSLTACHEKIYQAFLADSFSKALAHGHTFTANPLGCAAALASLSLLQLDETKIQIKMIERVHAEMLRGIDDAYIEKQRYCGTIAAMNLKVSDAAYGSGMSVRLRERFAEQGLLIRPLGNVIYLLPPYCVTEAELRDVYEIVTHELEGVLA